MAAAIDHFVHTTMRKVLAAFLFLLISPSLLFAQSGLPPAFSIKTDTVSYYRQDSTYFQVLPDPASTQTIGQVTSPE